MDKKGVGAGVMILGLFAFVLGYIVIAPYVGLPSPFAMVEGVVSGGCNVNCAVAPSVVWTAEEQYTYATTDTTASAITYFSDGVKKAGTPLTAVTSISACNDITYYGYVDSTTIYGESGKVFSVGCGNQEIAMPYWTVATYTALSNYGKNSDGTTNSATATQSFSAGDKKSVTIAWTGEYQKVYGHPDCGNVMVADIPNATRIDNVISSDMSATSVPAQVSVTTNHKYFAFKFPSIMSSQEITRHLTFDIDDTYGYSTDNITLTLYDCQQFHDGNTNTIEFGVEDENDANIGLATHDTLVIYTS